MIFHGGQPTGSKKSGMARRYKQGTSYDLIYQACQDIVDDVTLIYDKSYMLHIFDEFLEELPEFKAFIEYESENKMSDFVVASSTKAVPLKELVKELFSSTNLDNQDSTEILELLSDDIFDAEEKPVITDELVSFYEVILLELRLMVDSVAADDLFCRLVMDALIFSE